jgi:hypothetical protein
MEVSSYKRCDDKILYTGFGRRTVISAPFRSSLGEYFRFSRRFEAQTLSVVLPLIRAHRPELPHPVYENPN